MAEWVVQQWIEKNGTSAVLKYLPEKDVAVLRGLSMGDILPVDVLAFCLGFTPLGATFSIMLVCKAWYAATRRPQFWAERIKAWKRDYAEKVAIVGSFSNASTIGQLVWQFNPFCGSGKGGETLRHQVEWLFRTQWLRVSTGLHDQPFFYVSRRDVENRRLVCLFYKDDVGAQYCTRHDYYLNANDVVGDVIVIEGWITDPDLCLLYSKQDCRSGKTNIIFRTTEGATFTGAGESFPCEELSGNGRGIWLKPDGSKFFWSDKCLVPHGDGKWEFADGSILEGSDVAWKGRPIFPDDSVNKRSKSCK